MPCRAFNHALSVIPIPDRRRRHPAPCERLGSDASGRLRPTPCTISAARDGGRARSAAAPGARAGRLTFLTDAGWPSPGGRRTGPAGCRPELTAALAARGVAAPWRHQAEVADLARAARASISLDRHRVREVARLPAARAQRDPGRRHAPSTSRRPGRWPRTRLKLVRSLGLRRRPGGRGRRRHAVGRAGLGPVARQLPADHAGHAASVAAARHARWNGFFRRLRYIVVDECHTYRGVFGSHVAQVLRGCAGSPTTTAPPSLCSCWPRPPSASRPSAARC